jgi:hypothetical protein
VGLKEPAESTQVALEHQDKVTSAETEIKFKHKAQVVVEVRTKQVVTEMALKFLEGGGTGGYGGAPAQLSGLELLPVVVQDAVVVI